MNKDARACKDCGNGSIFSCEYCKYSPINCGKGQDRWIIKIKGDK